MINRRKFLARSSAALIGAAVMPLKVFPASGSIQGDKIEFRFLIASDGHFGQDGTPYTLYHENLVRWIREEKNNNGLDLFFINGDLTHDNPGLLKEVKNYFDGAEVPYYPVKGNHDQVDNNGWQEIWGIPENHTFEIGRNAFILLSTSDIKGKYLCADAGYLAGSLEKYKKYENVFVILHIPQFSHTDNGIDCPAVTDLFPKYPNVKAVFHGHEHNEDGLKNWNNFQYFFDGHFGGSWGTNYHGYRIVEVMRSGKIITYQFNPEIQPVVNKSSI
ncbi:MAG TPA: metallophosphoesterase [Cyclobacteriaceae bacterium]|nr:metallophosphoesterase [Cyclobacteriaceae bacterium]